MIVFPTLKIFLTGKNIECVKTFEVSLKGRDDEEEKQSDEGDY